VGESPGSPLLVCFRNEVAIMGIGVFTDAASFIKLVDHTAAGTTVVFSPGIDMAANDGYEGVVFITAFGTANALNYVYAQSSDDNITYGDFTSGTVTGNRAGNGNYVRLNVRRASKRYLRVYVGRGSSTTLESVWAVRYGARRQPAANANSVVGAGGTDVNLALEGPS
jgi:hypothetical protein